MWKYSFTSIYFIDTNSNIPSIGKQSDSQHIKVNWNLKVFWWEQVCGNFKISTNVIDSNLGGPTDSWKEVSNICDKAGSVNEVYTFFGMRVDKGLDPNETKLTILDLPCLPDLSINSWLNDIVDLYYSV